MKIDDLHKNLNEKGFHIIKDFFCSKEIDLIEQAIKKKKIYEVKSGDSVRIQNYLLYDRNGIKLLQNKNLRLIINELIGNTAILSSFSANILLPKCGKPWFHIDHPAQLSKFSKNFLLIMPMLSFQVIVATDDLTADNGATELIPGSHKNDNYYEDKQIIDKKNIIKFVAPKGSILIYNPNILHSNGFNNTEKLRSILVMGFCQYFIRPQEDIFKYLEHFSDKINDEFILNLFGKKIPDLQLSNEYKSKKKFYFF
jgi:hypothetical protein